ncbi:hypothetical protein TEA_022587 [Camellia sinensis var. sinensis]|uniref:Uncharacterized protein n=1 Tax=Camellia sinensis var. sinensis TaxID=542762 RepID=A0A4S4D7F0_CAMSN|nr:hypothetical protein TEA_022587 [Camellia sinensis var. sinensis]
MQIECPYFLLGHPKLIWTHVCALSKAITIGSRYGEKDMDNMALRFRHEELPETWVLEFVAFNLEDSSKMMKMIALVVVTLQIPRQMRPQMQQMVHPQNLAFQQQQQWERIRQRQPSTPRPGMDNIKPLVEVKLENPAEFPIDSNALTAINARHHPQLQFRQQQIAAMSNFHPQSSNQFRQLASLQIPQVQTPSMGSVRAPPVKVEGFQELMGGDATLKHDSEENKSTSPPK